MPFDVFISYSSQDKPTADAACAALESADIRCWIAPRDINPGRNYAESIMDAIENARVLVLIFSNNANASPQIKQEVERAGSKGLHIITLRIEDVIPNRALEYFISSSHWLDAFPPPRDRYFAKLVVSSRALLETAITGQSTKPGRVPRDQSESLASIIEDHALQARVEINAPLERVWHLIDDDDARQTWDQEFAGWQIHYLTERKSAGTRFVVRRKSTLFKWSLQGTIHAYLPLRAMSLRLDLPNAQIHRFRTLLLSRNNNMTSVESYVGFSSEGKYLVSIYRWFSFFLGKKEERQNFDRLKAAAEAQQLE
jgi:uncharacterized protein YndB with AHSA1/START domain